MDTSSVPRRHRTRRVKEVAAQLGTLTKDLFPMHRISIMA